MLSKNTALFLITTCLFSFILHAFITYENYLIFGNYFFSLDSIIGVSIYLLTPITWAILIYFIEKESPSKKIMSVVLSSLSGIHILLMIYFLSMSFIRQNSSDSYIYLKNLLSFAPTLILLFGSFLFGIAIFENKVKRIKQACIFILIGVIISVYQDYVTLFFRGSNYGANTDTPNLLYLARLLETVFPISLLLLALHLYRNIHIKEKTEENTTKIITTVIPTQVDWLGTYFLASIPLIGSILLIIWSFNNRNRIRRNWAMSSFIASIVSILVVYWFFFEVLLSTKFENEFPGITGPFMITYIILGCILVIRYYQQKRIDYEIVEENENPSIAVWLANFLIVAIPIIGLICLVIWSLDNKNEIIRKWAMGRLIWIGFSAIFAYLMYLELQ